MMQLWIDVEDAAGVRLGDGPIVSAIEWRSTQRLDAAGVFSFTVPASDPRAALLAPKRVVRCWGADGERITEHGAGIIDKIEVVGGGGALRVSGDDLLRELANRTVGDLELFQAVEYSTTSLKDPAVLRYQTYTSGSNLTLPASVDLQPYVSDTDRETFLYISHPRAFNKATLTLSVLNTTLTDTFQIQYYNARNPDKPTWETLGSLVNNSAAPGPDPETEFIYPFGVAGQTTIEFDPPPGWSKHNGYYTLRLFDQVADLTPFTVTAASVTVTEPVTDGLQRIMALAPDGWTLDPAGEYMTAEPVYMRFQGESVLAALVVLTRQTGEHFTRSASARRVWWLGSTHHDSALRAAQADHPSADVMAITTLEKVTDSYDLATRLYGYGGGTGRGRLTMASATARDLPDGWIIDPAGLYLENTLATALYGRIDRREDFPDIAPADASPTQIEHAANMLLQRIKQALQRQSQLHNAYRLEVAPGAYIVWPGQTLRVTYHQWAGSYHAINIDTTLYALEIEQRITRAGLHLTALTVATAPHQPVDDYDLVARLIGTVSQERAAELPTSSYTTNRAGVPVTLNILNGSITGVKRVNPIQDRWHPIGDSMVKTTNGIITAVIHGTPDTPSVFPPSGETLP